MGPLCVSYYFNDLSPSFLISAGVGLAHWYAPFEDDQETDYGWGFSTGIGYEFFRHCSINLSYMQTDTNREENGIEVKTVTGVVSLTLSIIGY